MAEPLTETAAPPQAEQTTMTDERIAASLVAELCAGLPEDVKDLGEAIVVKALANLRKQIEGLKDVIVREVTVDRACTSREAIAATGRTQYVDQTVVDNMPVGEGTKKKVFFIKPGPECYDKNGLISEEEVARQLARYGLEPDPRAQAKVNQDDPGFADANPNGSQWPRPGGGYDFATFGRWSGGERGVDVLRGRGNWVDDWVFGGVLAGK